MKVAVKRALHSGQNVLVVVKLPLQDLNFNVSTWRFSKQLHPFVYPFSINILILFHDFP